MPQEPQSQTHIVFIRGIPEQPAVTSVNVRQAPGLAAPALFRIPVGSTATCKMIKPDPNGDNFIGQIYDWFLLRFLDGTEGWVRNDLLELQGNFAALGYGSYGVRTFAFFAAQLLQLSSGQPRSRSRPSDPVCNAIVRPDIAAVKVRQDANRQSAELAQLANNTQVGVVKVSAADSEGFRWVFVKAPNIEGYIREDLLQYSAECMVLGLSPTRPSIPEEVEAGRTNRYDLPVNGSVGNGYRVGGAGLEHKGIDLPVGPGNEVRASAAGQVVGILRCQLCTEAQPSSILQGFNVNDRAVLSNEAWGFGFGNAVLVRYDWEVLPQNTREVLNRTGRTNASAYMIYAHLSKIDVENLVQVTRTTPLGKTGNTGNSTGPHLHLELRIIATRDRFGFPSIFGFATEDPAIFFRT